MFDKFLSSARSVVFLAREKAVSEGQILIEPSHIQIALTELHPELFEKLLSLSIDIQAFQCQLASSTIPSQTSHGPVKPKFSKRSKRVMKLATEEARICWELWEAPRRENVDVLQEDIGHWEARMKQTATISKRPPWFVRWMLRRTWEVDERHLLLGLLKDAECPAAVVLTKNGVTLEVVRQRLCATT
jgi:ATP-dependent Clp protease ATP-binding subunit ClpA